MPRKLQPASAMSAVNRKMLLKGLSCPVAIRYAAARYSAFEASMRTNNLAEDKDKQLQDFANVFTDMLRVNLEGYIKVQSQK